MIGAAHSPVQLQDGATVAIVGGGPAGAFSALHLLNEARRRGRSFRVVVFEQKCRPGTKAADTPADSYTGCPQCAGGISPRLHQAIDALGIALPPGVIQSHIAMISVQGNWKSIYLPVPSDRPVSSVYRGTLPLGQHPHSECFDAMLLGTAAAAGTEVIGSRVFRMDYDAEGRVDLKYMADDIETLLKADFVICAGGVNEKTDKVDAMPSTLELFRRLQPAYIPPRLRKAVIFELATEMSTGMALDGELHYIESSSGKLRLDMCSVLSKRDHITVTLIGRSIDESESHQQNLNIIKDFLALPQTARVLPAQISPTVRCICNPNLVVGTAKAPIGSRIAAVGDMATSRQYKDGILAAHSMAASVVKTIIERGVDSQSLAAGYGRTIAGFQKDNRYAAVIFTLYRWFFVSPFLSRIIYQAFTSEKKAKTETQREFKKIFWDISSGDGNYEHIARSMLRPSTIWLIIRGGVYPTIRNGLTEHLFGIDWKDIPRVMTGVSRDDLETRRSKFLPEYSWPCPRKPVPEFECMYSVRLRCSVKSARALLAEFGEKSRPYLNPRWVSILRTRGNPLQEGNVIQYRILFGLISFSIEQQASPRENLIIYRVKDGFAQDGLFCFEVEPLPADYCLLSVYLVFDYAKGGGFFNRFFWASFRHLVPDYFHDVLWNHALCEFKKVVETREAISWQVNI